MNLNNESKTLFIPLYGKALMSKKNLFLKDIKAEEIITKVNYDFSKLKQSKWLSMYMAARAKILDDICSKYIKLKKDITVVHLGCGLDSRVLRVNQNYSNWYDVDFKNVISVRKKFYRETDKYTMLGYNVDDLKWIDEIDQKENVLIIAEGLTMYLDEKQIQKILKGIESKFKNVILLFDAYSKKAVKLSKIKNPVKQMNAAIKWGMDDKKDLECLNSNIKYINSYPIQYNENNLKGVTKYIFNKLYCGKYSQTLYKIYEFMF